MSRGVAAAPAAGDAAGWRLPPLIGHRGAALRAPENTLAGFRLAARLGAPWVEFDVRLTAEGGCATYHDETLARTTGAAGRIDETPLAGLAGLDAGSWFDPAFAGEPVPSLDDSLSCIAGLGLGANIDLKPAPGREAEMAEALAGALVRGWPRQAPPVLVTSFDAALLGAVRRRLPALRLGFLVGRRRRAWRLPAEELGCASVHVYHRHVTPALAVAVKRAGLRLAAWVVDEPGRAARLWERGVDCLITGAPDVLSHAWRARRRSA